METGALAVRATGLQLKEIVRRQTELLGLAMDRVLPAETAILLKLQLVGSILLILGRRVVALLTLCTTKSYDITH